MKYLAPTAKQRQAIAHEHARMRLVKCIAPSCGRMFPPGNLNGGAYRTCCGTCQQEALRFGLLGTKRKTT